MPAPRRPILPLAPSQPRRPASSRRRGVHRPRGHQHPRAHAHRRRGPEHPQHVRKRSGLPRSWMSSPELRMSPAVPTHRHRRPNALNPSPPAAPPRRPARSPRPPPAHVEVERDGPDPHRLLHHRLPVVARGLRIHARLRGTASATASREVRLAASISFTRCCAPSPESTPSAGRCCARPLLLQVLGPRCQPRVTSRPKQHRPSATTRHAQRAPAPSRPRPRGPSSSAPPGPGGRL